MVDCPLVKRLLCLAGGALAILASVGEAFAAPSCEWRSNYDGSRLGHWEYFIDGDTCKEDPGACPQGTFCGHQKIALFGTTLIFNCDCTMPATPTSKPKKEEILREADEEIAALVIRLLMGRGLLEDKASRQIMAIEYTRAALENRAPLTLQEVIDLYLLTFLAYEER